LLSLYSESFAICPELRNPALPKDLIGTQVAEFVYFNFNCEMFKELIQFVRLNKFLLKMIQNVAKIFDVFTVLT